MFSFSLSSNAFLYQLYTSYVPWCIAFFFNIYNIFLLTYRKGKKKKEKKLSLRKRNDEINFKKKDKDGKKFTRIKTLTSLVKDRE